MLLHLNLNNTESFQQGRATGNRQQHSHRKIKTYNHSVTDVTKWHFNLFSIPFR